MQRYSGNRGQMRPSDAGPWVAWDDVKVDLEKLQAIRNKLQEYDHHHVQARLEQEAADVESAWIDYAEEEEQLAQEALKEAVKLVRR